MGQSTEIMAKRWQISRTEQDLLAYESHLKAAAAWRDGFYDDLVIEYLGLKSDNNVRADTSLDKLGKLQPSFDPADGTLTAGNSTPLTDGASAVLLAHRGWAARRNLPVLAYLRYGKALGGGLRERQGGPAHGARRTPCPAMLRDAGLTLQEFDYYEIHEAFAAQVLCTLKAWESRGLLPRHVLGLPAPARQHRPQPTQHEGRQRRARASVRRHGHAHRGDARQAAGRRRRRQARADLGLHGRRHGRNGYHRALALTGSAVCATLLGRQQWLSGSFAPRSPCAGWACTG